MWLEQPTAAAATAVAAAATAVRLYTGTGNRTVPALPHPPPAPVALRLYARLVDEHARVRRQPRKRQADVVVDLRDLAHRLGHLQAAQWAGEHLRHELGREVAAAPWNQGGMGVGHGCCSRASMWPSGMRAFLDPAAAIQATNRCLPEARYRRPWHNTPCPMTARTCSLATAFFSTASTMVSPPRTPTASAPLRTASSAYSTWGGGS